MACGTDPPETIVRRRRDSPPGGSILMTVAPAIAIRKEQ